MNDPVRCSLCTAPLEPNVEYKAVVVRDEGPEGPEDDILVFCHDCADLGVAVA